MATTYSTLPLMENKPKVNLTYKGELLATNRMTRKEVDKFVAAMLEKGYEIEVTYDGQC